MTETEIQPIIIALQTALLAKLGDQVDLVFQYGSRLRGTAHKYSDVDISYVPVHPTTWESFTVMVNETLIDLYPIHWSTLEQMAEFRNVSASVLLDYRILYHRNAETLARFQALGERLRSLQAPAARPAMLRRALEIFQSTGYDYYLLKTQAEAGHAAGCLKQAQSIFRTILHCLAVCNQSCVDTRKLDQVMSLPRLPEDFAETARCMIDALEPRETLTATETLLQSTRALLLAEMRQTLRSDESLASVFDSAYPELKRDLQEVMLSCERRDLFALKNSLLSLYHELARGLAQASSGVAYSGFNSLAEYEQDLTSLGFPALLPALFARDFDRLHQHCLEFDQRLQSFFAGHSVQMNNFTSLDELQSYLSDRVKS